MDEPITLPAMTPPAAKRTARAQRLRWLMLIYRVPSDSSRARVAVWRDLKRLGGLYVQQAVCVFPDRKEVREALKAVRERLDELGGNSIFLDLESVDAEAEATFVNGFQSQSEKEYAEIVEECETRFFKEIEFERFRENFTFEEAEEIRQDLEKLRRWFAKVEARDWLGAEGRALALDRVEECEVRLEQFESDVYERTGGVPELG